jgi:hypothetical protein
VPLIKSKGGFPQYQVYIGHPVPVDAPPEERLKEGWADRKTLCIYNQELQDLKLIHFTAGPNTEVPTVSDRIKEIFGLKIPRPNDKNMDLGVRLLVHFYAFLFFQDWKDDLWMKRFIRDHVRYSDEIQCAAARVVDALREHARSPTNPNGDFDSFHIRRGDFVTLNRVFDGVKILNMSQPEIKPGSTVYVATDEKDRRFFDPLGAQYKLFFLDDFKHLLHGFNTNKYGMLDQLVAARGRVFFGCWFSTVSINRIDRSMENSTCVISETNLRHLPLQFTSYIHRLRGYFANKAKVPGYENGVLPSSYYYFRPENKYHLQEYWPVKKQFYAREFPTSWRLIDEGLQY